MCGILGIVSAPGRTPGLDESAVLAMRDRMTSRGPDDVGSFSERNVFFAHRRLAIRDRDGGRQPWVSDDGQRVLVYNGEVYDDGSLRRQLLERGHPLRTTCDTELVMAAYAEWGVDCVEHLRGMFAFGLYDFREKQLLLARDRCGVKPLFVTEVDETLVFASSLPAILRHPRVSPRPNWSVVSHYLTTLRLTLRRETVYHGIWQLLPAERLVLRDDQVAIDSYWSLPFSTESSADVLDDREAVGRVERELREATRIRLASDVPVGMFTSGGVDSNMLACCVRDETGGRFLGGCGRADEGEQATDDFVFARAASEHVGFDYSEVRVSAAEYTEQWERLLDDYETPVSTPSDVVILRIAETMRPHVGVVLGGEGADELFCGYAVQHWSGRDLEQSQHLAAGDWTGTPSSAGLLRASLLRQYGRDRFADDVDHYFAGNSLIPSATKPALLRPEVWEAAGEDRPMVEAYAREFASFEGLPAAERQQGLLHRVNLEALLARLDTATMAVGLEARVPFTDHRLVEQVLQLPVSRRIDVDPAEPAPFLASGELARRGSLRSKRVLRSVASTMMPASLAMRPKASFPTPVAQWLSGPWEAEVSNVLRTSPFARELLQPVAIEELAAAPQRFGIRMWPLLNVIRWGDRVAA